MRFSTTILAALVVMVGARTAAADHETCTSWVGTSIQDAKVSVAGTSALSVMRTTEPDQLNAVPLADPDAARKLSRRASSFHLTSSLSNHLLVTGDGLKGAIVAQRLDTAGRELGAPITLLPESMTQDQRINRVLFDGESFVVVVDTASTYIDEILSTFVISTGGVVLSGPDPLVIAEDARLEPGPAAGTLWVIEDRNESFPRHTTAWVRGSDGTTGIRVDLGQGNVRGAAAGANGDLLVLYNAEDEPDAGIFAAVVKPDGRYTMVATGLDSYWLAAGHPDGYVIAHNDIDTGQVVALALDRTGTPLGELAPWAAGTVRDIVSGHMIWTDAVEAGQVRTSALHAVRLDQTGMPGPSETLASHRQQLDEYPCGHGCSAGGGGSGGALAVMIVLGLTLRRSRLS